MSKLSGVLVLSLFASTAHAESSIQYHYGRLSANYQHYTGRRHKVEMPVHELSLLDASGELSAAMSNISSEYAAREGAVAEEKRKIREGESLGGTKLVSYEWKKVAAQEGDIKRYGLRLGSTENIFSIDPILGSSKPKFSSLGEVSLIGAFDSSVLMDSDHFMLLANLSFGFRLGVFRDFNTTGGLLSEDQKVDSGYLYLPLTYRLSFILPFGLHFYAEVGGDPITLLRRSFDPADKKLPLDLVFIPAIEMRVHENVGLGLRAEEYRGSFIRSDRYSIRNPEYEQRTITAYINFSG